MNQETLLNSKTKFENHYSGNESVFSDKIQPTKIITAVSKPKSFCIGMVDIVDSTKTVDQLSSDEVPKYYEIFLNNMAKVVYSNNGDILKIMGDSLLFYFRDMCNPENTRFLDAMECGFSMINIHDKLNNILERYALPLIDFRISFDYGNVTVMKTKNGLIDLVGPTINTCAKINTLAARNNMVIGRTVYERIKTFDQFIFKRIGDFEVRSTHSYPIYVISRKCTN